MTAPTFDTLDDASIAYGALKTELATVKALLHDLEVRLESKIAAETAKREADVEALAAKFGSGITALGRSIQDVSGRVGQVEEELGHVGVIVRSLGKGMDYLLKAEGLDTVKGLVP